MRTPRIQIVALMASLVLVWCGHVLSQEGKSDTPAAPMPDMQEMMRKWLAAARPGEKHKLLNPLVGEWETTTRIWMGGPGAQPVETKGTASVRWVLDDRFLLQETDGEMLMPDASGQITRVRHKGMGLTGYDNYRNLYVATWADNAGTAILQMTGQADPAGKVFTFYGEMDEPMMDVRGRMVKYVTRLVDANRFVFEIIDLHAGDDYKVVEITYMRK